MVSPDLPTFRTLAADARAVPLVRRLMSDQVTPVLAYRRLVAEDPRLYRHNDEGPDDMPAHIRSALTNVQLSIPVTGGRLALGVWQAIYLFEHRSQPHRRQLALHCFGVR